MLYLVLYNGMGGQSRPPIQFGEKLSPWSTLFRDKSRFSVLHHVDRAFFIDLQLFHHGQQIIQLVAVVGAAGEAHVKAVQIAQGDLGRVGQVDGLHILGQRPVVQCLEQLQQLLQRQRLVIGGGGLAAYNGVDQRQAQAAFWRRQGTSDPR